MEYLTTYNFGWALYFVLLNAFVYYSGRKSGQAWMTMLLFYFQLAIAAGNCLFMGNYVNPFIRTLNVDDPAPWGLMARHDVISEFLAALVIPLCVGIPVMVRILSYIARRRAQKALEDADQDEKKPLVV